MRNLIIIFIFFVTISINSQFIDSVHSVVFGPNFTPGYGPDNLYFPQCIYGRHDTASRYNVPSFGPYNLLSLGTGGVIILRFTRAIVNRPGPDFTIFENPFQYGSDSTFVFAEVGIVSVSKNGVNFTEFPYRWDTIASGRYRYYNLAGATPSNGLASPFNWGSPWQGRSGGDSFDLDSVGIDSVYFVRIRDAANLIPDGGVAFDLDAIAVINQAVVNLTPISTKAPYIYRLSQNFPNPFNSTTMIKFDITSERDVIFIIYDVLGREVIKHKYVQLGPGSYEINFDASYLSGGIYFYKIVTTDFIDTKKMVYIK